MWLTLALLPSVFKKELDKDITGDTSGNFAKLLLALVQVASMLTHANTTVERHYHANQNVTAPKRIKQKSDKPQNRRSRRLFRQNETSPQT